MRKGTIGMQANGRLNNYLTECHGIVISLVLKLQTSVRSIQSEGRRSGVKVPELTDQYLEGESIQCISHITSEIGAVPRECDLT